MFYLQMHSAERKAVNDAPEKVISLLAQHVHVPALRDVTYKTRIIICSVQLCKRSVIRRLRALLLSLQSRYNRMIALHEVDFSS